MSKGNAVFIVSTYGSPTENEDTLTFLKWVLSHEVLNKLEKDYNLLPHPITMNRFRSQESMGKGQAIRQALDDAYIHLKGLKAEDVVIYMDGNQIDYNYSLKMIDFIMKNKKDFVASCRHNGMGISEERGVIERFENFLLSKRYGLPYLPDAQCGCWAFNGKYFEELRQSLESETFEIELEVMNFFLAKDIYPAFLGMDIGKPKTTTFSEIHTFPKLVKLSRWLKFNSAILYRLADDFQKTIRVSLPAKYIAHFTSPDIYSGEPVKDIKIWEKWEGIACTCDKSCSDEGHISHPCNKKFDYKEHHIKTFNSL